MKIAIICCSHAWGGLEKNILNFSSWLQKRGNNVLLIVIPNSHLAKNAVENGIAITEFKSSQSKHFNFKAATEINKILADFECQTLIIGHYNQHYTAVLAKFISFSNKIMLVYLQQMQHNVKKKNFYHGLFYKAIDLWITPLKYLKNQLIENTVLAESQIEILPLCCEIDYFTKETITQREARLLLNLPVNEFIVGIMGRIDKAKGQEFVIKAAHILLQKSVKIHVAIVGNETEGEGGYKSYLEQLTNDFGLKNDVTFIPYRSDSNKVFKAFDIFTICSSSEPFGMVTVEAMLSGIPVIGTKSGGTIEILEEGKLGILVPPQNEIELAAAIETLFHNEALRNQFQTKALTEASALYSHQHWCSQMESFLLPFQKVN